MSELLKIIDSFSDREFAFFLKHRLPEFTSRTKEEIEKAKWDRRITSVRSEQLINDKVELIEGNCLRCNSSFHHTEVRTQVVQRNYGGFEVDVSSERCIVCGYNPEIDKPLNRLIWIKKLFGFFNTRKNK